MTPPLDDLSPSERELTLAVRRLRRGWRMRVLTEGVARVAVAALFLALGHFEERQEAVAPHVEEIVADFLERRIAAVARTGAEPGRHFHRVDEPHAEHAGVEIDGHLHVVGVEREMMHAMEAYVAVGAPLVTSIVAVASL